MNNYQPVQYCSTDNWSVIVDTPISPDFRHECALAISHLGSFPNHVSLAVQSGLDLRCFYFLQLWHECSHEQTQGLNLYVISAHLPSGNDLRRTLVQYGFSNHLIETVCGQWPDATPGLHCIEIPVSRARLYLWLGSDELGQKELLSEPLVQWSQEGFRLNVPKCESSQKPEKVAVIGAGIAGSAVAKALCLAGVRVCLFDAAREPATGASGNWLGAFHPHITYDDTPLSRLTRQGFDASCHALADLTDKALLKQGIDWDLPGHLQTVSEEDVSKVRRNLAHLQFPEHVVRWAEPHEILATSRSGLFFPKGGWVKPARWVRANLEACGNKLETNYGVACDTIPQGFDAVVVACAQNSLGLYPVDGAKSMSVKGQITKVQTSDKLPCVLSGGSYAISSSDEPWLLAGATYERPVKDLTPTLAAEKENLERFKLQIPEMRLGEVLDNRVAVRSVWPDRLPAVGPAGGQGVYFATGFASRGLLWAELSANIISQYLLADRPLFRLWARLAPTRYSK